MTLRGQSDERQRPKDGGLDARRYRGLRFFDQFLEEGPVVNHGLTQFLCGGLSPHLPKRDIVSVPIIFQNQRMIHRYICRTLFKVTDWIASRGHYIAQQCVRFRDRTRRPVHEARLDSAPGFQETGAIARRERPDMKSFDSL